MVPINKEDIYNLAFFMSKKYKNYIDDLKSKGETKARAVIRGFAHWFLVDEEYKNYVKNLKSENLAEKILKFDDIETINYETIGNEESTKERLAIIQGVVSIEDKPKIVLRKEGEKTLIHLLCPDEFSVSKGYDYHVYLDFINELINNDESKCDNYNDEQFLEYFRIITKLVLDFEKNYEKYLK